MIYFPGFNLSFSINPIAGKIFGIAIYHYAICIILAIVVAVVLCYKSKEKFQIKFDFILETLMFAIMWGFVGARIYYVLFHVSEYSSLAKILQIRDGGLALYGGLIAGGIVILKRCRKYKIDVLDFFDEIIPFIAIAQSIGRWGNFFNQEAYGTETDNVFRMGIQTLEGYKEVHPAFLYESFATFLLFILLKILQKNRKFKGEIFYVYLFFYSSVRMLIEGIRVDSLMFYQFRISQVLSGAIFVISGIMLLNPIQKLLFNSRNRSKMQKKVYKKVL